jgi:hypothetical protein
MTIIRDVLAKYEADQIGQTANQQPSPGADL